MQRWRQWQWRPNSNCTWLSSVSSSHRRAWECQFTVFPATQPTWKRPPLYPLSNITSNLQPPAQTQSPQIPCVSGVVPPPAPTPDPHTAVLGASPWDSHSPPTTIHNVTNMVETDWTLMPLPPPASDPVDIVSTGALWPQPCPAWKTIPFKKKPKTKHMVVQHHDQDLHPP